MAYIDHFRSGFCIDDDTEQNSLDRKYDALEGLVFTGHPTPPNGRVQELLRLVDERNKKMWEDINDVLKNSK